MYYAGYKSQYTDVAIFKTENSRDAWLQAESFFDRIALDETDAEIILGIPLDAAEVVTDLIDDAIRWLVNPANQ